MQIQCPECDNALSVGAIKPGKYTPKCTKCGKPFAVIVVDGDPPKITVAKLKLAQPPNAQSTSVQVKRSAVSASAPQTSRVDATMDGIAAPTPSKASLPKKPAPSPVSVEATMAAGIEATMDSGPGGTMDSAVPSSTVDATMVGGATEQGNVDATRQRSSGGVRQGNAKGSASGDFSGDLRQRGSARPNDENIPSIDMPERLGGYRILRLLGRGAMGAVYEAKQVSLDRNVAIKTIRGRLADNPSALARFTREAYAAAQLVHHNVVQIYDFGEEAGQHFFSMEWVRGGPISDLIRDNGPCDSRVAATYTLQAARGLQFAHRHGMVHRDVKPANLLLNEEGVVKVADLGLVKVPDQPDPDSAVGSAAMSSGMSSGTQVTMMGTAVGTPAYMAPEQGVDATTVDHRADIYSLGCSLFFFLTGKAPFDGSQVSEVMRQHAQSPVPKVQSINSRVPEPLSRIIERSMAKRPEDRYSSLAEMITELESFLGLQSGQGFSPTHQQADRWEELSKTFSSAPLAKLQRPVMVGSGIFTALLFFLVPLISFRYVLLAPAAFGAALIVALTLGSAGGRSIVTIRVRSWLGSLSWFDYVVGIFVVAVTLLVGTLVGLLPGLLIGVVLGAASGAAYHFLLVAPLRKSRETTTIEAEKFVRDLRIEGIDEEKIRDFSARYSGRNWKPLFEELFGYDAMADARSRLLADPAAKSNAGGKTIRDWLCASLQAKTESNRIARDHKRLATLEEKGFKSEGMTAADAKERAWQMASAMIDAAKVEPTGLPAASDPKAEADQRRNRMKAMIAEARSGKYAKKRDKLAPLRFALGGKMRLLAGCSLLAMFGMWAYKNDIFSPETIANIRSLDVDAFKETVQQEISSAAQNTEAPKVLGTSGLAVGIAGILMVASAFISGWRMSLFAIPAVVVAILGPSLGIPSMGPIPDWTIACAAAFGLMIPGVLFGDSKTTDY